MIRGNDRMRQSQFLSSGRQMLEYPPETVKARMTGSLKITRHSGTVFKKPSRSLEARYTSRYTLTLPMMYIQ